MGDIKISYFNKPRRNGISRRIPLNTPCGYCFEKWATCWDHIIPYSLGGPTNTDNLMPACRACNAVLNDKVFNTITEKREYIRMYKRSNRKIDFDLSEPGEPVAEANVLFTDVPMESLGALAIGKKVKVLGDVHTDQAMITLVFADFARSRPPLTSAQVLT